VSGTANWLVTDDSYILSLDLKKESYQQLLLPDFVNDIDSRDLSVLKDCLCFFASCHGFLDVWIMNEYGNKESWTKLYSVPNMQDRGFNAYNALYISEDDQMLLECCEMGSYNNRKLVVYDSKTGTSNIPEFQNNYKRTYPHVYIESWISP
jgi:F-box interacting protein